MSSDKPIEVIPLSCSPQLKAWVDWLDALRDLSEKEMMKLGMTKEQLGIPNPRNNQKQTSNE